MSFELLVPGAHDVDRRRQRGRPELGGPPPRDVLLHVHALEELHEVRVLPARDLQRRMARLGEAGGQVGDDQKGAAGEVVADFGDVGVRGAEDVDLVPHVTGRHPQPLLAAALDVGRVVVDVDGVEEPAARAAIVGERTAGGQLHLLADQVRKRAVDLPEVFPRTLDRPSQGGRFLRVERQPPPDVRSEDEDDRTGVQREDPGRTLVPHAAQKAGHRGEVPAEARPHVRGMEADPRGGGGRRIQRQRALVEQADVAAAGVRRPQEPLGVVAVVVPVRARGDPAQGVDGDAELVLQVVERRLDVRVGRPVVAALETDGLHVVAFGPVVPAVVPGDGDRAVGQRLGGVGVLPDGTRHRVDDERLDGGAAEHVGAIIEAGPRRERVPALGVEGGPYHLAVGGVYRAAAVDVGDVRRQQQGGLLPPQQGGRPGRAAREREAGGAEEPPARRILRGATRYRHRDREIRGRRGEPGFGRNRWERLRFPLAVSRRGSLSWSFRSDRPGADSVRFAA